VTSSAATATATCAPGKVALGGGFSDLGQRNALSSFPSASGAWTVALSGTTNGWKVFVICA
jgi:hypothetical protein